MKRYWAFAPFAVLSVLHLAALLLDWYYVSYGTRFALMPALLLGFLVSMPSRRTETALLGGLAVLFSWGGDVLLADPGELGFLFGLGSFLAAHVAYLVLYLRPLRRRPVRWEALVFLAWWVVLLVVVVPHVGVLAVPVVVYGLVMCAAAAASLGTTPMVATGAVFFLVSDSVLALRFFLPGFSLWEADSIIMFFYLAGQGLIIVGAVRAERQRLAQQAAVA